MSKKGFYPSSQIQSKEPITNKLSKCGRCGLYKNCRTPKMGVTGKGRKEILIVAEAPGKQEDREGTQLIGDAGQLLRRQLKEIGVDLDKDCWKTNAVICRPPNNKTPDDTQIECCRPNLFRVIKEKKPKIIILLGKVAIDSLIGYVWKEGTGSVARWAGFIIPCFETNSWIAPTYHPSFLLRNERNRGLFLWFNKHLKKAVSVVNKPLPKNPNYKEQIEIITNTDRVVKLLNKFTKANIFSFDFETNCLKPEYTGAQIISCSVCVEGKRTIAYPWTDKTALATKALLKSPCKKIAANLKFEDRWARFFLDIEVKNWFWDTMICAHVLDSQPDVTGLKFQSFAVLGQVSYDNHIKPFLTSTRGHLNRIKKINLNDLLLYNGLDSLLEYKLAMKQIRRLKKIKVGNYGY